MLTNSAFITLALWAAVSHAAPIPRFVKLLRREVPQEHSHEPFLTSVRASLAANNPLGITDPVFGLLGNAAAAGGISDANFDLNCLQQATADQAFTNAKAAGDVTAMTDALIYRALERNTGSVGLASVLCTSVKAVNPEIAAVSQHQDPASSGAAATNKAIVLALAQQIASIGGNPQDALKSGTFAPGTIGDPTAKGNTCDDANDPNGCIFTDNLLVDDATAEEISAAVGGSGSVAATTSASASAAATTTTSAAVVAATTSFSAVVTPTVTVTDSSNCAAQTVASTTTSSAAVAATTTAAASSTTGANLQTFTGALGGLPPAVTVGGRGFEVAGEGASESDLNLNAALQRSCSVQHNTCADAANASSSAGFTVSDCDTQNTQCNAAFA